MANLTSPYGRQDVAWPDLGSDPGVTLHSQITSAIAYLSNNVTARWSGSLTLGASATAQIEHKFDTAIGGLKIFVIEAGVVLSKALQDASYTFTQVDIDTIQVQNISGVSKTFQVYVYPSALNIRAADLDPAIDISTTGSVYLQNKVAGQQASNSQSGTLVTLTEPSTLHTVLSSATLSSVQGITAPTDSRGRVVIFTNGTGGVVSFSNDAGTAANRLLTGTGADLQLDNNASVLLKYDTSVSKWRVIGSTGGGSSAITVEQAHSFTVGQAILFNGTSYVTAQANTAANAEVIGIVSKVVDGDTFQYVSNGEITGLSGLTSGEVYFLSDATPGLLTVTEPTTVGNISIPVGIATSTTKLMVGIKRGVVVGGANLRTQIGLANNATTTVQNASGYDAGSIEGWVYIDGTTDYRFHVRAQFAKAGLASPVDYNLSYQTTGDTPPAGFSLTITSAGLIQATLPTIAGFASAYINFALNAPAVGATLPLSINEGLIVPDGSALGLAASYSSGSITNLTAVSPRFATVLNPTSPVEILMPSSGCSAGWTWRLEARGCSEANYVVVKTSGGTELERIAGNGFIQIVCTAANTFSVSQSSDVSTLAFANLSFSAVGGGTVSVDSGDISTFRLMRNRVASSFATLKVDIAIGPITVAGTVNQISVTLPSRFSTFLGTNQSNAIIYDNTGSAFESGLCTGQPSGRDIQFVRNGSANFTPVTNATFLRTCSVFFTN